MSTLSTPQQALNLAVLWVRRAADDQALADRARRDGEPDVAAYFDHKVAEYRRRALDAARELVAALEAIGNGETPR